MGAISDNKGTNTSGIKGRVVRSTPDGEALVAVNTGGIHSAPACYG